MTSMTAEGPSRAYTQARSSKPPRGPMKSFSLEKAECRLEMLPQSERPAADDHRYFEVLVDAAAEPIARIPPPPPLPKLPPEVDVSLMSPALPSTPPSSRSRRLALIEDDIATVAPPVVSARALVESEPPTFAWQTHAERERRWKWRIVLAALVVVGELAFAHRAAIQQASSRTAATTSAVRAVIARLAP